MIDWADAAAAAAGRAAVAAGPMRPTRGFPWAPPGCRRRPGRHRLQRRERLLRPHAVRRVRPGLVAARHRAAAGWSPSPCAAPDGDDLLPCGRCRQLLHEHGGADLLVNERRSASCCPTPSAARRTSLTSASLATPARAGGPAGGERLGHRERRRRHPGQARRAPPHRRADRLVHPTPTPTATVADEQAAALCMAIFLRGMEPDELARWTGGDDRLGRAARPLGGRPARRSTSTRPAASATRSRCVLAPLVAACGAAVPQLSGRGPRPHRRHARQARVDPGLAGLAVDPTR